MSDKYEWHDLRANKEDLPKQYERVLFCTKEYRNYVKGEYKITYYSGWYIGKARYDIRSFHNDDDDEYMTAGEYGVDNEEVLAWKYIEPFDGIPVE